MFMFNLLFDFNNDNGTFDDLAGPGILNHSKHWARFNGATDVPAAFNPEPFNAAQWRGPFRGTVFIPHGGVLAAAHGIGLRIAPTPASAAGLVAAAQLDIAVAFGRPTVSAQGFASPFVDATGATLATFIRSGLGRPPGNTGWFVRLDRINKQPSDANLADRYEFAVGIVVRSGGVTRTYGEDPEFDIGT